MLAALASEKAVKQRVAMAHLRRLWRAMDDPDGKKGIVLTLPGGVGASRVHLLRGLSPSQATCVLLVLGTTAFWSGTSIGLGLFGVIFDVAPDVKQRVLRATYVGMAAMYLLVIAACARLALGAEPRRKRRGRRERPGGEAVGEEEGDASFAQRRKYERRARREGERGADATG